MKFQAILFAAPILALANVAYSAGFVGSLLAHGDRCEKAPCAECCVATVEEVTVKKTCFEVECKQVCIPQVCIPWPWLDADQGKGKCCQPRCGKVRNVRVLTKRQYEATECRCVWTPVAKGYPKGGEVLPEEDANNREDSSANRIPTPPLPGGYNNSTAYYPRRHPW